MRSQVSWLDVQICESGSSEFGSSRLPTVTSIQLGSAVSWNVSAVPHAAQNVRVACGVERSSAGAPAVNAKASLRTVAQVTNGAPLVRRQMLQWQWLTSNGLAVIR